MSASTRKRKIVKKQIKETAHLEAKQNFMLSRCANNLHINKRPEYILKCKMLATLWRQITQKRVSASVKHG